MGSSWKGPCLPFLQPAEIGSGTHLCAQPPVAALSMTVSLTTALCGWEDYAATWDASLGQGATGAPVALLFAPNAGLWGYTSWMPALQAMLASKAPTHHAIFTAYNLSECEEDQVALEEAAAALGADLQAAWEPEACPTGCVHVADPKYNVVNGRCWQAVSLGLPVPKA